MNFANVADNIEKKCAEHIQDGYIGENGLLYCKICNAPQQSRIKIFGSERIVPSLCKCGEAERDKRDRETRCSYLEYEYDRKRALGLTDLQLFNWFSSFDYQISPRLIKERSILLKRLCFPEAQKLYECTFANDDRQNESLSNMALEYVENFAEMKEKGIGLLLFGKVGRGKTNIAACIANALIDKGIPAQMTSFERLANILMGMFKGKQEYIDDLNKFELLVIDDLAAERDTEAMGGIVHNIIDSRIKAGLPMIITTNLDRQEMLGTDNLRKQRIYSRLFECCIPYEVTGNDRRMNKLQENRKAYNDKLGLGIK